MKEEITVQEWVLLWLDRLGPDGSIEFRKEFDGESIFLTIRNREKIVRRLVSAVEMNNAYFDILSMEMERGLEDLRKASLISGIQEQK